MDAQFWANVFANIIGGINVLFNNNVSDRLNDTLEAVTNTQTFSLNPDEVLPFYRQIFYLAAVMSVILSLWGFVVGLFKRSPEALRKAVIDFFGTFLIGSFGLSIYSVLGYLTDQYGELVTGIAKSVAGTRGHWYDTIIQVQNSANPAESGVNYGLSQFGAYLLANQVQFIQFSVVPVIMFTLLAFVFRDGHFSGVFLKLGVAFLAVVLFTKMAVSTWLAVWSIALTYNTATGIPQLLILAIAFCGAGLTSITLFILFFIGRPKFRASVFGGLKQLVGGKKARDKAAKDEANVPARPSPTVNPSINPANNSAASPSVREKGQQVLDRGKQAYSKTKEVYVSSKDKVEKTNRIAHKVVIVSDTVGTVATFAAPKTAAVPYLGPIVAGTAVAARVVNVVGKKVEAGSAATLHPVDYMGRKNAENTES